MRPYAAAGTRPDPASRDPLLVGLAAALLVHVAVLGPILFDMADDAVSPVTPADIDVVPIDMTPFHHRRREARSSGPSEILRPSQTARVEAKATSRSPPLESFASPLEITPESAQPSTWDVRAGPDEARRRRVAEAMRLAAACRNLSDAPPDVEHSACARRRAERDARIGPLSDPANARFEAEGAAELAAYEGLRAPVRPPSPETRACPNTTDMMGRCPVQLNIPLFSSRRGFLPGLRKDERK